MDDRNTPLITFALFAFNQEKFIAEAIEGAFAQNYRPLQIIISDDGSTDKTPAIIQEMQREYKGSATVCINLNKTNLGLCAHINQVMGLAKGELIVVAAGDDISYPHRTTKMVEAWEKENREPLSILSTANAIDEDGNDLGHFDRPQPVYKKKWLVENWFTVIGCAHAWSPKVFRIFGPLWPQCSIEDTAIVFRSAMAGRVLHLDEPLVKYRRGVGITKVPKKMSMQYRMHVRSPKANQRILWGFRQRLEDLKLLDESPELIALAECNINKYEFLVKLGNKNSIGFSDLYKLKKSGASLIWIFKKHLSYKYLRIYYVWLKIKRAPAV